ncbi:MAG: glycosyltransferase family 2 protein [Paracoccaceae bacterium]|nr:glycosyltransferase family 2 protein [Paracoccaceae bacterium]MDG2257946.1 glycosyltransferase family 2 protein [Paracoccaceae bacterium]
MRIFLHIGPDSLGADRIQETLDDKRDNLITRGVLFPKSLGPKNHTRLFMAMTDPEHVDVLRFNRGFITPEKQTLLRDKITQEFSNEIARHAPHTVILSASQLGSSIHRKSELERIKAFLSRYSSDIRVIAHVEEQSKVLSRYYAHQVQMGRTSSLATEMALAESEDWWSDALAQAPQIDPANAQFAEIQAPAFWLDYSAMVRNWEEVFGEDSVDLRTYDEALFNSASLTDEIAEAFDIEAIFGKYIPARNSEPPAEAALTRARQLNIELIKLTKLGRIIPRKLWNSLIKDVSIDGCPLDAGSFSEISTTFADQNADLVAKYPALTDEAMSPPPMADDWKEADPKFGYRPTQYLLSFIRRIERATKEEQEKARDLETVGSKKHNGDEADGLTQTAREIMPDLAKKNFQMLQTSSFKPHNNIGTDDEAVEKPNYGAITARDLPKGNSGNVIVGCMKNEAPYILEWVAYHRAIGVDNFLIYTNDCSDGTSEILDRLQELGILQHRNNDKWKGNSPQQYALNQALKEDVIKNAEWVIHIDVDEFMNIRMGNGTLPEFLALYPDVTNVAMTWRLFGHNGVTQLNDDFVIDQFDHAAPKFCPKPHTVWGFKTMFKNIGAYEKISCHRPNKLDEGFREQVKWINGSGRDMTREAADKGWRSSTKSIGYDQIQLNHYALRSAESYLVKRQRGRALHVDRSIGINYWIRMDWSDNKDVSIKRNMPRLQEEFDRLITDSELQKWHSFGREWHRNKAAELHNMDEFEDLYQQALTLKLTETERVAYALALDMDS